MLLSKWKIGVVGLLALAAPVRAKALPPTKAEASARPPLNKEWVGRWQVDPFADTVAIEILASRSYRVNDPQKIAALMKKLTIRAFHNGMARDFPMIARLTFHKKDGTSAFVWVGEGPFFSGIGGEMHIDPAFLNALGQQFPDAQGQPLDLLKRPPSPPQEKRVPLTLDSLKMGFESFAVTYYRGSHLREARITDRKALDELAKSLTVATQEVEKAPKVQDWPAWKFHFIPRNRTNANRWYGCLLDGEHLVLGDLGRLTMKPSFVKTLNEQLSRLEGRTVDVLGKNPPPKEQLKREQALQELFATIHRVRFRREDGKEIVVERPEEVKKLLKSLSFVETPARRWELERIPGFIEVTTDKGKTIRLTYLRTGFVNNENVDVDNGGDLVEVEGFGRMWVDPSFRHELGMCLEQREWKEEERRDRETFRLVSQDLPAFLDQVFNLVVTFRRGKVESRACLTAATSGPILQVLRRAKVEKLSRTAKQWDEEAAKWAKRGAGTLELTPGMGFSISVLFTGEKELLVPGYGRILLDKTIVGKLRKALESDAEKAKDIEFLPR